MLEGKRTGLLTRPSALYHVIDGNAVDYLNIYCKNKYKSVMKRGEGREG
jgi:hypothetical protein